MSIFNKGTKAEPTTPREALENKYKNSISNILLVLGFTAVNVVLLLLNSNTYFLFSAFLPYMAADYGMYFCGLYPEEYYYGDEVFFDKSFLFLTVAIAVIMLLLYFVSWVFAKKKKVGWLIFALVFFCIDTVAMLVMTEIGADSIIDIAFHVWVIVSLASGVYAYFQMKKLPADEPVTVETSDSPNGDIAAPVESRALRMADSEVNARVFVQADYDGKHIEFRRVKRTNELVINGVVYDEHEALAEGAHTLTAVVGGQKIEAVFDGFTNVFICVDGQEIAKEKRLY